MASSLSPQTLDVEGFNYASKNPGVFTDARCYMHWIAAQYGMTMPNAYELPRSCSLSRGRKDDIDKPVCKMQTNYYQEEQRFIPCPAKLTPADSVGVQKNCTEISNFEEDCRDGIISGCLDEVQTHSTLGYCDWDQLDEANRKWSQCRLVAAEGFSYNVFQCKDMNGEVGTCSNNCRGVDPNAIIIGGSAVLGAASAFGTGLTVLQAAGLGGIGLGAVAAGGTSMFLNNARCPNTRPCRVRYFLPLGFAVLSITFLSIVFAFRDAA